MSIAAAVIVSLTLLASADRAGAVTAGPCQDLAIPATAATPNLNIPEGVAVDGSGNIHATDLVANTVYTFDAAGSQVLAIPPTAATPNLSSPRSVAVDGSGNIYTTGQGTLHRFDSTGVETLAIPSTAATPNLTTPAGVAVDGAGNIYATDTGEDTVYRFDATGVQTMALPPTAADPDLLDPRAVAVDGSGNVHVVDAATDTVYRFGTQLDAIDVADEAQFRSALTCLSADSGGPHVVNVTAEIDLDDGTDRSYTGSAGLTLEGNGHTIDAGGTSNILTSSAGTTVVRDITMRDGSAVSTLGGAIYATGAVDVPDASFLHNSATFGGAILSDAGSSVVRDSSFVGNEATFGGAIQSVGALDVRNSTFAGTGGNGVPIRTFSDVSLAHVTVAGTTTAGRSLVRAVGANLSSTASVFADPGGAGVNCLVDDTVSGDDNWSDDTSCGFTGADNTEVVDGDPLLGPPRDNGSPPTMFPLLGSPLVDAIDPGACDASLVTDKRGVDRPFGPSCDVGAIESVFSAHGFTDVTPFYNDAVTWATHHNLANAFPDNTYRQTNPINRGNASRIPYNLAQTPTAWNNPNTASANMSFRPNLGP